MCSNLFYDVHVEMNFDHLCFVFYVSVSLLANLPEDKLSKIVDCLEVVSYSVKLSILLLEGQLDFSLYFLSIAQLSGSSWEPQHCR